ncbi:MAG: hypothetical protein KAH20_08610 [Methylococcales bacterium]|nr:hypothetical protein [Methylococcales bacterium]
MQKLLLPIFWVIALIGIFILSSSFSDKSVHFFGIAGEREQIINFQYPVEVVQSFVVEGKVVKQGEEILEVKRYELDSELSSTNQEIRQYQLQKKEAENSMKSQLANLKARKQAVIADMDYQIHVLELRYKMNTNMLNSISGENSVKDSKIVNTELDDLKRKRHFSVQAIQAEIDGLFKQLNSTNRPIDAQINELFSRKIELQRQTTGLKVKAQFDGRIGSVNFKTGELVSPFQPIMSVHSRIPRYIKGYINENILNDVKVGHTVWVKSIALNKSENPMEGVVESLGNRIVEYPERLKKNALVPAWGREVVVRLNNLENPLLFGEKVQVLLENPKLGDQVLQLVSDAEALDEKIIEDQFTGTIKSTNSKIKANKIEASGVLWNPKSSHYILLNDEEKKGRAGVYIMDEEGVISQRLDINGLDENGIDDLESISFDKDYFYILSSLSHNKKDKLKAKRRKLIRFKYQQHQVTEHQEIDLYKILVAIKDAEKTNVQLASFLNQAIDNHSIDIEAHFIENNSLYLGFKTPFKDGKETLLIKIKDVESLFKGGIPQAENWQAFALLDPETGKPMQLSDMLMIDDQLFLLSSSRSTTKKSVLWRYHLANKTLKAIRHFSGLKAEGISYRPEKSMFMVVFDEGGKKKSKFSSFQYSIPVSSR